MYLDGVEQTSGWSVDTTTGLVTFGTAPALGVEVTADFEFDVPVRFDTKRRQAEQEALDKRLGGGQADGHVTRDPG